MALHLLARSSGTPHPARSTVESRAAAARQGFTTSVVSKMWVRSADGDLVPADAITGLRCRAGEVEACRLGGGWMRLVGPRCPQGFHPQLPAELCGRSDSRTPAS